MDCDLLDITFFLLFAILLGKYSSYGLLDLLDDAFDCIGSASDPPNETVEKLFFSRTIPGRAMIGSAVSRSEGNQTGDMVPQGLVECPKSVDLADIVYQSEQPPLYIHFQFRA